MHNFIRYVTLYMSEKFRDISEDKCFFFKESLLMLHLLCFLLIVVSDMIKLAQHIKVRQRFFFLF